MTIGAIDSAMMMIGAAVANGAVVASGAQASWRRGGTVWRKSRLQLETSDSASEVLDVVVAGGAVSNVWSSWSASSSVADSSEM